MSFESLEDNFLKKANEPVKTDVQHDSFKKQTEKESDNKETYEDNLVKKQVIGGLAALFQETIKNSAEQKDGNQDSTVFVATDSIRYGDNFVDATNYVEAKDMPKFMPGDTYNESIKEPELEDGDVHFDQKHSSTNKYNDNLSIEPNVAKETDIHRQSSISKSVNAEQPYTDDEMLSKINEHNEKKLKQFSENTWNSSNVYTTGPQIDTDKVKTTTNNSEPFAESELTKEEYEKSIKTENTNSTNND